MDSKSYSLLLAAYNYYNEKNNRHFMIYPKNSEHYLQILRAISELENNGYITNLSDTCRSSSTLSIVPPEYMSFDITIDRICYVTQTIRQ